MLVPKELNFDKISEALEPARVAIPEGWPDRTVAKVRSRLSGDWVLSPDFIARVSGGLFFVLQRASDEASQIPTKSFRHKVQSIRQRALKLTQEVRQASAGSNPFSRWDAPVFLTEMVIASDRERSTQDWEDELGRAYAGIGLIIQACDEALAGPLAKMGKSGAPAAQWFNLLVGFAIRLASELAIPAQTSDRADEPTAFVELVIALVRLVPKEMRVGLRSMKPSAIQRRIERCPAWKDHRSTKSG